MGTADAHLTPALVMLLDLRQILTLPARWSPVEGVNCGMRRNVPVWH